MLQPTKNLKANPPGSLPVAGVASATPAHAGRRPGSEDAGRRARAGRGLGGADGSGVWQAGARMRVPSFLLAGGRAESRGSSDVKYPPPVLQHLFRCACSFFLPFDFHHILQKLGSQCLFYR